MPLLGKLVVGRAGDDGSAELGYRLVVETRAKRAGREHVGGRRMGAIGGDAAGAEFGNGTFDGGLMDVGDDEFRAGFMQAACDIHADMTKPLDGHRPARRVVGPEPVREGGPDALENAKRGIG